MVVEYAVAGAILYRCTTPDVAARFKMSCGAVKVDRQTSRYASNSPERDERVLPARPETAEIMMWVWAIGAFSVAAVVNQIAIVLCRRAQACTEPYQYEHVVMKSAG
jgi:hypothetical protein